MAGPIISLSRWIAKKRNASTVPTGIIPLGDIHSVTLIADGDEPGVEATIREAVRFFASLDIPAKVFTTGKENIGLLGRIRRKLRYRGGKVEPEDLLICLSGNSSYACRYEAVCSRSRFKIGRFQLSQEVFDVVFQDPEGKAFTQMEVFRTIADFLKSIK